MTVCSEPVSSTKSICGPRLTFALTMIFSLMMRNGIVCSLPIEPGSIWSGRPRAERPQESHFGARPRRFRAAILVGQQIDVARIGVGRFFVAAHALVDRAHRVVEFGVARILVERRLRRFERLVQLVARGEAARQAVQRAAVVALRSRAHPGTSAPNPRTARRPRARRHTARSTPASFGDAWRAAARRRTRAKSRRDAAPT